MRFIPAMTALVRVTEFGVWSFALIWFPNFEYFDQDFYLWVREK